MPMTAAQSMSAMPLPLIVTAEAALSSPARSGAKISTAPSTSIAAAPMRHSAGPSRGDLGADRGAGGVLRAARQRVERDAEDLRERAQLFELRLRRAALPIC